MSAPKRRFRLVFYVAVPLLAIVVALLIAEGLLALFYPIPEGQKLNMVFDPDPVTGFRIRPNSKGFYRDGIPANANSHGHRDDEIPLQRARPETLRVLVLGDSFTVGTRVRQEESWPEVLERRLKQDLGRPVEVINAAVGGWNAPQYALYYEHRGRSFAPDLVLVGFTAATDAFNRQQRFEQFQTAVDGKRIGQRRGGRLVARTKLFFYDRFHVARLLLTGLRRDLGETPLRAHCADFDAGFLEVQTRRLRNHRSRATAPVQVMEENVAPIERIRALAAQDGIPLLVALLPDENQINPALQQAILGDTPRDRYDFDMPQKLLHELFAARSIPVVDVLPAFRASKDCLYLGETHANAAGHRLAADTIYPAVRRHLRRRGS